LYGDNLAVNAATNEAVDEISRQPEFKYSAVSLSRVELRVPENFSPEQANYLSGFFAGRAQLHAGDDVPVLSLPDTAPFSAEQRKLIHRKSSGCAGGLPKFDSSGSRLGV
jgi:hypothetical protein